MIQAKDICFSYGKLQVLKGFNLHVKKGEFVSISGASGSGKTTLLQLLGTLERTNSGEIIIDGKEVQQLTEKQLAVFRNKKIGFIFQFHNLLEEFNVLENVCIPGYVSDSNNMEVEEKAKEILKELDLSDRITHKPNELSGGEQQRVSIARSLINSPDIIFADEPTGNLDSENSKIFIDLIRKLNKKYNQTFVIVTHNKNF